MSVPNESPTEIQAETEPTVAEGKGKSPKRRLAPKKKAAKSGARTGGAGSKTDAASSSDPGPVAAVLALFEGPLSSVEFPDINAETLTKAVAGLEEEREKLEVAKKALEEAESSVERCGEELAKLARRALAYAKVFAEEDPQLSEAIAAINFGRSAARGRRASKRGEAS